MTRVAVTGGTGKLGRAAIRELIQHGYEVVNLDVSRPVSRDCRFMQVDFNDYGQTFESLTFRDVGWDGVDALVHLAAIPGPYLAPDAHLFRNNTTSTFNVFHAARAAGIRNIVWASSETILGVPFETPPTYVPLDEESPAVPNSAYALGKLLEEQMALQMCRWDCDLKMLGLRFSYVKELDEYWQFPSLHEDPKLQDWNLWSYVDARDAAQAVRLALEVELKGAHSFIIASPDTVMSRSTADLMNEHFPAVPVRGELGEHGSLLSIEKAKGILGYLPSHTWRDEKLD
ncbi:NAD-dependent epimerase/dehydratase family protein [Paraburkholderia phenoliruptrix]|uniref:NAD-dependent epimerase/dehydratase family protein n=1 Tax=Paraburkholderia phenoliruptrix TaxID=252970 RepID=UPI0028698FA4|nr:NAD(P)-dependent oxidoreductase [Paraburkholderia phenoliruptrix]WMY09596.1 NAD(P)-dependent oxidoreductase [Paraburkholderia phenoliruptrix]